MSKQLKGFVTRDDFITPRNQDISPIYEISETGLSYSKYKKVIYPSDRTTYTLHVFDLNATELTQTEVGSILRTVINFTTYVTHESIATKQQIIINFLQQQNTLFPDSPITEFSYNNLITHNNIKAPDYLSFRVSGVECSIWLSDQTFRIFYPNYTINPVLPFSDFSNIVGNVSTFITALDSFDPVILNDRLEFDKGGFSPTHTRVINIPYRIPNTPIERNCYFGFNIYGRNGNYEYILKLELYRHLTEDLGLNGEFVEYIFPQILNINEFFITPRWDRTAIPFQVGQTGIATQVSKTYSETFDTDKFVRVYSDLTHLRKNTYNVPINYNNLLLQVTNGYYNEELIRDFAKYYKDLISVSSTHPDFARMTQRTQRFLTLLENMLEVGNVNSQTELFNKVIQSTSHNYNIIDRAGVTYLSIFFEEHQYYLLPKYRYNALIQE